MKLLILLTFLWFSSEKSIDYSVSRNADPVVEVALDMMSDDLEMVTDQRPNKVSGSAKAGIRVIQYNKDRVNLKALGVPSSVADSLRFTKEAFYVGTHNGKVIVVGSDGRGTAYGILELSRLAGVSPWVWWGDAKPEKRTSLELPDGYSSFQHPSVEYRGFFLNDEDWAFRVWAAQHHSPQGDDVTISADSYRQMFKLLLRLRGNTLWPGMHPQTTAFFQVEGAKEAADSCGIFIGTSHCEPLLRNNVGEWDEAVRGRYNYLTNKKAVQDYWIERLVEMGDSPGLYTIGMRGIHDGSMEGLSRASLDEKTVALQEVIDDQRVMLQKYINKDITKVPQMFMPYKEVLEILENGLNVPEDVTIVWCDDNYGYMTRLSDPEQQKRSGGGGVYYHLSYCGRPHDYLWLTTTQPGLIYHEMRQAYDHNVRKLWVANVNDPKKAAYDLEFFLDMAWDINSVGPQSINAHLERWLTREYGKAAAEVLFEPMVEYYRLCSMRKPEFMGWSQVELPDKQRYPGGLSQVVNTEFSFTEFGNEAQRHIDNYRAVQAATRKAKELVPERSRDFYFANISYPVEATTAMAEKMLYAQKARSRNRTTYSPGPWKTDTTMLVSSALSSRAYQKIRTLTDYYNNELADGKWKGAMNHAPRDLYVFWAPQLPIVLTDSEAEAYSKRAEDWKAEPLSSSGKDYLARNAATFASSSATVTPVQNLGHSGAAVPVAKGESLSYNFSTASSGKAVVRVAVIPTQANDRGDIRFSVSVDGAEPVVFSIKEPYRSDRWKLNVMRGQAVVELPLELAEGAHTLTLAALDDHIIFDQWMVDYKPGRKFYVFPVE